MAKKSTHLYLILGAFRLPFDEEVGRFNKKNNIPQTPKIIIINLPLSFKSYFDPKNYCEKNINTQVG